MKKNIILYNVFLGVSLGLMIGYRSKLTSVLFVFSLIITALIYLLGLISRICFRYTLEYSSLSSERGEASDITLTLKNNFFIPISPVEIYGYFPLESSGNFAYQNMLVSVPAFSGIKVNYNTCLKYRGVYDMGIEKIQMYDLFHIFKYTINLNDIKKYTVFPKQHIIEPIQDSSDIDSENTAVNSFALEKNSFAGVREYQPEDSIKHIHWSMSAKQDKLMVKQFERSIGGSCIIIADFNEYFPFDEQNWEYCDSVMETMLAINLSLLLQQQSCTNIWYSPADEKTEQITLHSIDDFSMLFDFLSVLPRQTSTYLPENIAESFIDENDNSTCVYFITSQLRQDFVSGMQNISLFKNKKIRILLLDSSMESEQQIILSQMIASSKETELWKINKDDIRNSLNTMIEIYRK